LKNSEKLSTTNAPPRIGFARSGSVETKMTRAPVIATKRIERNPMNSSFAFPRNTESARMMRPPAVRKSSGESRAQSDGRTANVTARPPRRARPARAVAEPEPPASAGASEVGPPTAWTIF
jgi:hypothetical protein